MSSTLGFNYSNNNK